MLSFIRTACRKTNFNILEKKLPVLSINYNKLSQNSEQKENFVPIYKFKYIQIFSVINRLKIYQAGLTAITIPSSIILNQFNIFTLSDIVFATVLGLSGCATLFSLGHFTKDVVGIVYYNESKNIAKISYADDLGRRKDIEIPVNDIVPFSEQQRSIFDGVYLNLERYSTRDKLRINVTQADIINRELFKLIFSDVEIMNKK